MPHNRPPVWVMVGLAVLLLFGIGSAIHNAGWSQGYTWGLMAGSADGPALTPYLAYRAGYGVHPFGGGNPFGCLFGLGLIALLGIGFAKLFGCRRWHQQGHGWQGPWGQQPGQPPSDPGAGPAPTTPAQATDITPQPTAWINV